VAVVPLGVEDNPRLAWNNPVNVPYLGFEYKQSFAI